MVDDRDFNTHASAEVVRLVFVGGRSRVVARRCARSSLAVPDGRAKTTPESSAGILTVGARRDG